MSKTHVTVDQWTEMFRVIGLTDETMHRWHAEFERRHPEGHQGFLEWLGLPNERIADIRRRSAGRKRTVTIGQLARRFGLSRSTLLYYDSIGLLRPSGRTRANYRVYTEAEVRRMELIEIYRRAGLPLADIARVLDSDESDLAGLLEKRLRVLNDEIRALRRQQGRIVGLLQDEVSLKATRRLDKAGWIAILRASGMGDAEMERWHVEFERLAPEAHQDFLESLDLGADEIARIRDWSRSRGEDGG